MAAWRGFWGAISHMQKAGVRSPEAIAKKRAPAIRGRTSRIASAAEGRARRWGIGVLAVLAALGLLGAGGVFIAGLDVLNHGAPLFLAAAIGLACYGGLRRARDWRLVALGVAGGAASLVAIAPDAMAGWSEPAARPDHSRTITVLTQNVWERNPRPALTASAILRADADVVLLQEALGPSHDIVALLGDAYPYRADTTSDGPWASMAILSKRPILQWSYHYGTWQPPAWDRLGYVRATIDGGAAGRFEIIDTQLVHPDAGDMARKQMLQLLGTLDSIDPRTTILAGDFNRVPWLYSLKWFDAHIPIRRRTHGLGTWPNRLPILNGQVSWPAPFLPIDQLYAGSQWRVESIRRAPSGASDHYGVLATLVHES